MTNREVFVRSLESSYKKLLADINPDSIRIRPNSAKTDYENEFYSFLIKQGVTFHNDGEYQLQLKPKVSFTLRWNGKKNEFAREMIVTWSLTLMQEQQIVMSKSSFDSFNDIILREQVALVAQEDYEFSNDVALQLKKNTKRRIFEPVVVLLGMSASAYLLFTLRL